MKIIKTKVLFLSTLLVGFFSPLASAEVAIIVHPDSGLTEASKTEVVNIFLSKSKSLRGKKLTPYDLSKGQATRDMFYQNVVRKNESQLKAYWSRLIFTGKGLPPTAYESEQDIIDTVADDASAIGYVSSENVNGSVKVLATF